MNGSEHDQPQQSNPQPAAAAGERTDSPPEPQRPEPGDSAVAAVSPDDPPKKKKKKKKRREEKPGLGSSRGVETMFRTSYRVHMDLTALADSKANIMISINGLILSIILASVAPKIDSNAWLLLPTTVVLLSCLAAIIFAVLSARPRINASTITLDAVRSGKVNLLFFGNYRGLEEDQFVKGMSDLAMAPDLLYRTMMRDLYGIGNVLNKKFELLRKSYMVFMYGLTISVLSFILVFVIQALEAAA